MSVDPSSRGWNEHRHILPIHDIPYTLNPGSIEIGTRSGFTLINGKGGAFLASNVYFDGAAWMRIDTAAPSTMLYADANGRVRVLYAAPGANPISTWTYDVPLFDAVAPPVLARRAGAYLNVPTFSTTSVGTWTLTPAVASFTPQGRSLLVSGQVPIAHSVSGGVALVGLGWDGAVAVGLAYAKAPAAGEPVTVPISWSFAAGSFTAGIAHTMEVWVLNSSTGTCSIYNGVYTALTVVELNS